MLHKAGEMVCSFSWSNHDLHPVVTGPHHRRVQLVDVDSSPVGDCGESTLCGVFAAGVDIGALFLCQRNEPVVLTALDVHYLPMLSAGK
ncbi:hypothetical protein [Halococcus sp. AFM35]|uniref:hypothetical protein n=1 Tax=Halococcus sp. AFM35 TaxID=3421653 RepID=UPI003EB76D77